MTLTAPASTTDAQTTIEQEAQHVVQTYPRPPFVLTHGEGVTLYDSTGNAYLDMVAGIAVNALGYSDPDLTAAITAQADQLIHVSNLYHTAPQAELAAQLCDLSFADKVFFNNSGSEANETAIKFARKWAYANKSPDPATNGHAKAYIRAHHVVDKTELVTFSSAFHGRTAGALSVTPRAKYQDPFKPLLPDVKVVPFNDLEAAAQLGYPLMVKPALEGSSIGMARADDPAALRAAWEQAARFEADNCRRRAQRKPPVRVDRQLLGALQARGMQPGDELVVFSRSNLSFVVAYWAAMLGGIVPVPVV